jgi:hypothetical protein
MLSATLVVVLLLLPSFVTCMSLQTLPWYYCWSSISYILYYILHSYCCHPWHPINVSKQPNYEETISKNSSQYIIVSTFHHSPMFSSNHTSSQYSQDQVWCTQQMWAQCSQVDIEEFMFIVLPSFQWSNLFLDIQHLWKWKFSIFIQFFLLI